MTTHSKGDKVSYRGQTMYVHTVGHTPVGYTGGLSKQHVTEAYDWVWLVRRPDQVDQHMPHAACDVRDLD